MKQVKINIAKKKKEAIASKLKSPHLIKARNKDKGISPEQALEDAVKNPPEPLGLVEAIPFALHGISDCRNLSSIGEDSEQVIVQRFSPFRLTQHFNTISDTQVGRERVNDVVRMCKVYRTSAKRTKEDDNHYHFGVWYPQGQRYACPTQELRQGHVAGFRNRATAQADSKDDCVGSNDGDISDSHSDYDCNESDHEESHTSNGFGNHPDFDRNWCDVFSDDGKLTDLDEEIDDEVEQDNDVPPLGEHDPAEAERRIYVS